MVSAMATESHSKIPQGGEMLVTTTIGEEHVTTVVMEHVARECCKPPTHESPGLSTTTTTNHVAALEAGSNPTRVEDLTEKQLENLLAECRLSEEQGLMEINMCYHQMDPSVQWPGRSHCSSQCWDWRRIDRGDSGYWIPIYPHL